ncbi:hypothetical protein [Oscillibacter sp.]|uniref:hypothetical protein n=1 Tax=Oscillibacter sp. TaxID=1945593 RepID=UPI00257B792A|nr:hypothetical protein [Oscillibacter sp.]
MAEFDDKLNSILSNPDAMAQIMQLAQSLSGGTGGNNAANAPPPPPSQPGGSSRPAGASSRRLRRHPAAIPSPPWPVGWIRSCSCGSCP